MVKSMYSGIAGLQAHQYKMDIIANNIANVNTNSYKTVRTIIQDSFYQTTVGSSAAALGFGGTNPAQTGFGSMVQSTDTINTTASASPTGNPLDVMIAGNGYFMVGPEMGEIDMSDEGIASGSLNVFNFTRVGALKVDGDGNIIDANGNFFYGFSFTGVDDEGSYVFADGTGDEEATLSSLKTSAAILADGDNTAYDPEIHSPITGLTIGSDGTLQGVCTTIDEETGASVDMVVVVGKLAIANVPNPGGFEKLGNGYLKATTNTGTINAYAAGTNGVGSLQPGALEMSGVDLSVQFADMITTQRGFQANTKIITVSDEMLTEIISMKR